MSPDDYPDYSYYYDNEEYLDGFGLCKNTHVKHFGQTFLPIFYSIVCTFSIIANLLLIVFFIKYGELRKILPLNMVISDLLFATTLPFWAVHAHNEWIFGDLGCKIITLIYMVNLYSSNLFVASMSLYVYLDMVCAFSSTFKTRRTRVMKGVMCAVVWIISFLAAIPHFHFVKAQDLHGHNICSYNYGQDHKSPWKIFMRFQLNILGFLIPLLVMLFCSIRILCVVVKTTGKRSKTLRRGMTFTVVFFVLWFPYNVVVFFHALQELHVISDCATSQHLGFAIQVTECIAYTHACLNPVFYVFLNKKIWKHLGMKCRRSREYVLEPTDSTSGILGQDTAIELQSVQNM